MTVPMLNDYSTKERQDYCRFSDQLLSSLMLDVSSPKSLPALFGYLDGREILLHDELAKHRELVLRQARRGVWRPCTKSETANLGLIVQTPIVKRLKQRRVYLLGSNLFGRARGEICPKT